MTVKKAFGNDRKGTNGRRQKGGDSRLRHSGMTVKKLLADDNLTDL